MLPYYLIATLLLQTHQRLRELYMHFHLQLTTYTPHKSSHMQRSFDFQNTARTSAVVLRH